MNLNRLNCRFELVKSTKSADNKSCRLCWNKTRTPKKIHFRNFAYCEWFGHPLFHSPQAIILGANWKYAHCYHFQWEEECMCCIPCSSNVKIIAYIAMEEYWQKMCSCILSIDFVGSHFQVHGTQEICALQFCHCSVSHWINWLFTITATAAAAVCRHSWLDQNWFRNISFSNSN